MDDLARGQRALRRRFESETRRFVEEHSLLPEGSRVLVAASGGPDSTALLLVLSHLAKRLRIELAVAHFDHGLRGSDVAERESRFVLELAAAHGLPFFTGSDDVRASATAARRSLEDAARHERYAFLAGAAREAGCNVVATGHTASDQAETVLQHIIRGAGLDGLGGIAPKTRWPFAAHGGLSLIRPLLRLSHADTLAYCEAHGVHPLADESNASPDYQRNRVRHELLPSLRLYNPNVEDALVRLADAARDEAEFMDEVAAKIVRVDDGTAYLPRTTFSDLAKAPRRHALRLAIARLLGDAQEFSERHVVALERLVLEGQTGDHLDLPRGLVAELTRDALEIGPSTETPGSLAGEPVVLSVPGEGRFGSVRLHASPCTPTEAHGTNAELDAEAVGGELRVRSWLPGDRFQPLGMSSTKKLQDFFVDAYVPRRDRASIPLFENDRGIVWVGGLRIADWAKPREGKPTVFLSYASC